MSYLVVKQEGQQKVHVHSDGTTHTTSDPIELMGKKQAEETARRYGGRVIAEDGFFGEDLDENGDDDLDDLDSDDDDLFDDNNDNNDDSETA